MLPIFKQHNILAGVLAVSTLLFSATTVQATNFTIDQFTVTKNGNTFFEDTFSNGDPNNTGWIYNNNLPATYITLPDPLTGPESNGRLSIDPYSGIIRTSPLTGELFHIQRARLRTNIDNNSQSGLKVDDTFSVRGLFDLTLPTQFRERFGVRLTDRASSYPGSNDIVEIDVRKHSSGIFVEFREQDVLNSGFNVFESVELSYATLGLTEETFAMYDQIALQLERPDVDSNNLGNIFGSFSLVDSLGVATDFLYNLAGSATIFEGESYTRAEFIAAVPDDPSVVPESSALLLFAIGLIGFFTNQRSKNG